MSEWRNAGAPCLRDGCGRTATTRGYCKIHYIGEMQAGRLSKRTEWERFWEKVDVQPGVCWEWQACRIRDGYGQFGRDSSGGRRQQVMAHRYAWEVLVGPIAGGMTLDHLCRNTCCVNPDHLEPVPAGVNTLRGFGVTGVNLRKKLCKHGHDNWRQRAGGGRVCITCRDERRARVA